VETATSVLQKENLSQGLWPEATHLITYLNNRSPRSLLEGMTAYEAWSGTTFDVRHFKVLGSNALLLCTSKRAEKKQKHSRSCEV
jgi:hypothetical protein